MAENKELALVLKLVADEFQSELKNSQGALSSFNNFIKDWRTQLAAAGTALFALAKSTADFGEEALKGAQRVGTTVEKYTALAFAAKMADVEGRSFTLGLKTLSERMVDASRGTGEGADVFRRLGVSAVDATGKLRPVEEVLLDVAQVFQRTADGAGKTEASVKLFSRAGLEMLPMLNQGRDGITAMTTEAQRLGVVMSRENAEAAARFNDAIKLLDAQVQGFALSIGTSVLGVMTDWMTLMKEFGQGPIGKLFKLEMQGLSSIFTLLGHAIKETALEVDIFFKKFGKSDAVKQFWNDVLQQSKQALDKETSKRLHQIFQDQLGVQGGRSVQLGDSRPAIPSTAGSGRSVVDAGKEQEQLALKLVDIWRSQNNALEIQKKNIREALDLMFQQEAVADRVRQDMDAAIEQEEQGRLIVSETISQVKERELQRERDGLIKNLQAWIAYDEQVGASTELRLQHQLDLVRANLAQQLSLTNEQAGKLIQAWQEVDSATQDAILNQTQLNGQERVTIELQTLTQVAAAHQRFSGDIFQGWALGLQRYLQDTQSAFGFAADVARRTAQMMEGAFRSFFFDLMDNKIKSLKDLFASFANFAKQMIAQVLAQLATMAVLKGITGGFGGFGFGGLFASGGLLGGGGFGAAKFARGGPVLGAGNLDRVPALLTPGEGVLNRRAMATLDQLNNGGTPGNGPVTIHMNIVNSGRTEQPQVNFRRQFKGMVMDVIWSDPDFRNMLGGRA